MTDTRPTLFLIDQSTRNDGLSLFEIRVGIEQQERIRLRRGDKRAWLDVISRARRLIDQHREAGQ